MKTYNYNREVKNLVTLFINALNDVVIKRYNEDKVAEDQIHVNFRYSPKTRTLSDIVNKNDHLQLPIISCWITNLKRDNNRVFNNIDGSFYNIAPQASGYEHLLQPLPVSLTMNVAIIARFQEDIDQIIDNILVWFDPYIVVSQEVPYFSHEVRSVIQWSQNTSLEYPTDINGNQHYRIIANTSFEILGWLYKPPQAQVGKIYKIDMDYIAVSAIGDYSSLYAQKNIYNTDSFTISARPQVFEVIPSMILTDQSAAIQIKGDMFQFTSGVYISATPSVYPLSDITFFDLFSSQRTLSAHYPPFSGISISSWVVEGEKEIYFTIPAPQNAGKLDIIVYNEAGYGKLTIDSLRSTTNPYPSSLPEYYTYVPWQPSYVSGVDIVDLD